MESTYLIIRRHKKQHIKNFNQYCTQNDLDSTSIPDDFKNLAGWKIISTTNTSAVGCHNHGSLWAIVKPRGLSILALSCIVHHVSVNANQKITLFEPSYFSKVKYELNKHKLIYYFKEVPSNIEESDYSEKNYLVPNAWFTETYYVISNEGNVKLPRRYESILDLKNFYENFKNFVDSHSTEQKNN